MNEPVSTRKIAILGTLPPIRALSSYCFELAHAIAKKCRVAFISYKSIYPSFLYPAGKLEEDDTYPPVDYNNLQVKRRLTWYNPLSWFIEGITTKADLLHAQWWSLPLFPVYLVICTCFAMRGKPIVFTVHNVLPHEKSLFFKLFSRILFAFGNHFIVHSEKNRRQMISFYHLSSEKVSVIPHGSLDFHKRANIDKTKLKKDMGFDHKDKIILLFGAIRPYKGVDVALNAMPEIIKHVPEAHLLVAGRLWEDWSPYESIIKALHIEANVRLHLQYIPSNEVYKYFEISDLALFPYRHFDSQSGAGATAASFCKPMIVSNVGGLPELATDNDLVVEPEDSNALSEKVIKYLKDPLLLETVASRADQVSSRLDWTDIAKKTIRVYEKQLQG